MKQNSPDIIVAGHICLDLIPTIESDTDCVESLLAPGKLVHAGPILISTGGAVSNTGLALHHLGVPVELVGKIGSDSFGQMILERLESDGCGLSAGMICSDTDQTSYCVVLSPPNIDRIFIHYPGANDTFRAEDIDYEKVDAARLFHLGYPPLMRSLYKNDGRELIDIFKRVKNRQITTSVDMALPDPDSPAGRIDWSALLVHLLPWVDIFLPSLDEILFMLDRDPVSTSVRPDARLLEDIAQQLMDMGAALVVIKLGENGLYLQTTEDKNRLAAMGRAAPENTDRWAGVKIHASCFEVEVVGATGAGDCSIAGFLAGLVKGLGPKETLEAASAVGACNVEVADAVSGIPHWDDLQARINAGWNRR